MKKYFSNFRYAEAINDICAFLTRPTIIILIGLSALYLYSFISLVFYPHGNSVDTQNFNHWASMNFRYASSTIDLSVISPVQGLGGLTQPIGVWLHPAYILPHLFGPYLEPYIISFFVVTVMLSTATLFLGRVAGLSFPLSVFAAEILIFSSFRFSGFKCLNTILFNLVPATVVPASLATATVALFLYLGTRSQTKNILALIFLPVLVIYSVLCDPLYTAVFFIPALIFGCGIILGSDSRSIFLWRLMGVVISLLIFIFIDLGQFYRALMGYSARVVFPNEIYSEVQRWDYLTSFFSQSYYTVAAAILIVVSVILTIVFGVKQEKTFVSSVLVYLSLMICISLVYVYSGIHWNLPSPSYFEFGAHASYVVAGLIGVQICWKKIKINVFERLHKILRHRFLSAFRVVLIYTCILIIPLSGTLLKIKKTFQTMDWENDNLLREFISQLYGEKKSYHSQDYPKQGVLITYLEEKLAINPGRPFRGSVATVIGVPGGPIARKLGFSDSDPVMKTNFWVVPNYLIETLDKDIFMNGLWNLSIPTLKEWSQTSTPFVHFLFSRTLSRPHDFHSRNDIVITKSHPKIMAALGARFILTDEEISDPLVRLRTAQANSDGIPILLYEIDQPNLANYFPTRVRISKDASETVAIMTSNNFSFKDEAILHRKLSASFVPGKTSAMFFEKGGVRVKATSRGFSLLVLPLQFSNSLQIISMERSSSQNAPKLMRVNLLQTAVVFKDEIDIKIAHVFGPFRGVKGRLHDIQDCRDLGVRETGEIPYPPDFQPLKRDHWIFQILFPKK